MEQRSLPRTLEVILANRFSAAALVVTFFAAAVWLPVFIAGNIPILAGMIALSLHMLTIVLLCCVHYGGGSRYAFEVGLLATIGVFFVSSLNEQIALLFLLAYVIIPWFASSLLVLKNGLNRSVVLISACCCLVFIVLAVVSDVQEVVKQNVALLFDAVRAQQAALGGEGTQESVQKMEDLFVLILPAALMQVVWLMWLWAVLAGRMLALRYQFYTGDTTMMSSFSMHRVYAGFSLILLIAVFVFSGYMQYIFLSLLLFVAGLFAFQGVIVAREWLKKRNSHFAVGVMYVVLFIQPMMLVPFVMIGFLDVHFDYRCAMQKTSGGE